MPSSNIDEVILKLESIVENAIVNDDHLGVFAQLYLCVTKRVKNGIINNEFEDGPRMERLDVIFANRYLDAFDLWHKRESTSKSWSHAFEAAKKDELLIMQHLFMGMNAHINLDLGIAAAETVEPQDINSLEKDFNKINSMLIEMIEEMQQRINKASPLLFILDWFGKKSDEHLMAFSLRKARSHAWSVALRLSNTKEVGNREKQVSELDNYVSLLNKFITSPGIVGSSLSKIIKLFEEKKASRVISLMQ